MSVKCDVTDSPLFRRTEVWRILLTCSRSHPLWTPHQVLFPDAKLQRCVQALYMGKTEPHVLVSNTGFALSPYSSSHPFLHITGKGERTVLRDLLDQAGSQGEHNLIQSLALCVFTF